MQPRRFTIPFHQERLGLAERAFILNASDLQEMELLAKERLYEQDDAILYSYLQSQGANVQPRIDTGLFDRALVILSKHTEFNKAMIGRAWQMVREGGDILVEGAKTDGVDSLIRGIKALGLSLEVEPKSHGKIAWFRRENASVIGSINKWIEADEMFTNEDGYRVRAGIFSPKNIDKGTAFLLENLTVPIKGTVADFGGGYGAISRIKLEQNPEIEALDLYESSHLALECAQENIKDPRAHFHWLDVKKAAREYYQVILSNPPFHKGRHGDPSLGLAFIEAAARSLRARGAFYMVANRHLPYETRLQARFGFVEVIAQNNAYKLFKATRPSSK